MNDDAHPDALRLDALALGGKDEQARAHLGACAACAAYVSATAKGALAFREDEGGRADAFVAAVQRARERSGGARSRSARGAWVASSTAVLALAAGALLYVHQRPPRGYAGPVESPMNEGPVRFKGGMQTIPIVEHAGVQSRRTSGLELEPGDRVRLEIALDHSERIEAGVLTDEGEWSVLQDPALLSPGTHYSERSILFEGDVPSGWLLVGDEEAVERARRTRDLHEVTAIRVQEKPSR
jgi:hypothetical protein